MEWKWQSGPLGLFIKVLISITLVKPGVNHVYDGYVCLEGVIISLTMLDHYEDNVSCQAIAMRPVVCGPLRAQGLSRPLLPEMEISADLP